MWDFLGVLVLIFVVAHYCNGTARDDSDSPNDRSGMRVYTDHLTGCQYLGTFLGGLTARLDKDGKPICAKVKE